MFPNANLSLRKFFMNTLIFILLVVSCTDDFNSCYSNNTMATIYPTAEACEQAMIPSTKKFASYGQQIFAQCTKLYTIPHRQEINLIWSVTNRGNFLLQSQNISHNMSTENETDVLTTSSPPLLPSPS
ncbi:hypothetical protein PRJBM_01366 [Bartonella henselae]|uniref:Uncharacterized protein n=2 Tax=Bartonellaceae TaxID=772 RepID=A0A0H3M6N2_BARHE|nr:hypothetical protein Q654_01377 [Bartonella henselae JK 50]ETS07463.1 hypothetical protein Q655_01328 [Bartonella henselae JK 51]ETS11468.1 hypothetical protein Q653_00399 [Bartonella henselae JK 42]ETS15474.1 hypothetical protein Q652_00532 [Bartonella henselae JK 41]KEC59935.1 hypothetical protein O95_00452 [Bartonella henselae JK 53]KEC60411.1 hypothetical protein O97_00011 [Bartonella henselae str. Zeus]CAF28152.1 hypothetical protein BH13870 [Bartonella henselae str. Houston-1]CDO407